MGEYGERYGLEEFRALARAHGACAFRHEPGRRNAIAVFPTG